MIDLTGLRTLFLSYNGIQEPLVRSQVLSYQGGLAATGASIKLITFERRPPENEGGLSAELSDQGIEWSWLPYSGHLGLLGTWKDIVRGARAIAADRSQIDLIHARSLIPTLMAMLAQSRREPRLLFDVRGFFAHEKRMKGNKGIKLLFPIARQIERQAYRRADAIVALTHSAMEELENVEGISPGVPRAVIPTCVDIERFDKPRGPLSSEAPRLVYAGSLGPGYRAAELAAYFQAVHRLRPEATLRVLTHSDPTRILAELDKRNLSKQANIGKAPYERIPQELRNSDVGIAFAETHYATLAMSPTKLGEYLASGLVVAVNTGVGDAAMDVEKTGTGVILNDFTQDDISRAAAATVKMLEAPGAIERSRCAARRLFSLEHGIARYAKIYASFKGKSYTQF